MNPADLTPLERLTREPGSDDDQEAIVTVHDAGLAELDRAKALLAHALETMDLSAAAEVRDRLKAAAAYHHRGTALHADAALMVYRAGLVMGEISRKIPTAEPGRPKKMVSRGTHNLAPTETTVSENEKNVSRVYQWDEPTKKQRQAEVGLPVKELPRLERAAKVSEQQRAGYEKQAMDSIYDAGGKPPSIEGLLRYAGIRKAPAEKSTGCKHCPIHGCPPREKK